MHHFVIFARHYLRSTGVSGGTLFLVVPIVEAAGSGGAGATAAVFEGAAGDVVDAVVEELMTDVDGHCLHLRLHILFLVHNRCCCLGSLRSKL